MKVIRQILRFLPTLLTALILAMIVWVSAVSSSDPNEILTYPKPIPLSYLGLDPDLVIAGDVIDTVTVIIRAPRSIQQELVSKPESIHAFINLSGLEAGVYTLQPEVNIDIRPARVEKISPETITVTLENLLTREFRIDLQLTGSLPIGYEASEPSLDADTVLITGPESKVNQVVRVIATVDINNVTTSISRTVELKALDNRGAIVNGVSLNPTQVTVDIPIRQLGGYRNVFVKVVTTGQVGQGFYLTGISVSPPTITIYTTDPALAANMPAYIETVPISLNGVRESFESVVALNLPEGIRVVGEQNVTVTVGIAAIQSSLQLVDVPIEAVNVASGLKVTLSPDRVNLYLSGPLYLLELLNVANIRVIVDLQGKTAGTYQLTPTVDLSHADLELDSILPATIEVVLAR
jgi:YbbR domain-containing protein